MNLCKEKTSFFFGAHHSDKQRVFHCIICAFENQLVCGSYKSELEDMIYNMRTKMEITISTLCKHLP